jgi:hypothetical protein
MTELIEKILSMVTSEQVTLIVIVAMLLYSNFTNTRVLTAAIDRLSNQITVLLGEDHK